MPTLVAEVKTQSPFGFKSPHTFEDLLAHAVRLTDFLSIHVLPEFGGGLQYIRDIRAKYGSNLRILAKGYHHTDVEIEASLSAGADCVLVVGRIPGTQYEAIAWVEPDDWDQFHIMASYPGYLVWNQRNLKTGQRRKETFTDALSVRGGRWLAQASMITRWADIHPQAQAAIVGEHLMSFQHKTSNPSRT